MFEGKTWWIIGASEGLGAALAHQLNEKGAHLILSARSAERLTQLSETLDHATTLPMDVTDAQSVRHASQLTGPIDGLIYCVGLYEPMSATQWTPEQAEKMVDANFTGALRVVSHSLPDMLARRSGRILLIGSLAGHRGMPGAIGYSASKAALMHLGENLKADLKDSGVRVQVANPGFIRTRLTDKNQFAMPQIMTASDAASRVIRHLQSNRFACNFPAPFAWLFTLGRFLPLGLFQRLFG